MKQCRSDPASLGTRACVLIGVAALAFSCKGSQSPNTSSGAPPLRDRTETGTYSPYYATAQMGNPRYAHEAIRLKNGLTLVTGGSDERGFIAFDTAELFDEVGFNQRQIRPPTLTGLWLDTDFEGAAISMEFRRLWHTMTLLPNNKVLLVGGAGNWIRARPVERVEVFDPDTRKFETLEDARMVVPRVRHTANFLPTGQILIAGGQVHDIFSELVGQATGFGQTQPIQINTDIFPSIDTVEVFSFHDLSFNVLTFPESTRQSKLTSVRGRAGHVTVPFAGLDNKLGTNDDLFLLVGGFQTARAADLVPRVMAPRQAGTTAMQNLEVFDPALQAFIQIGTAALSAARVNDPQATNLGVFNDRTPDGVPGLGNVIFVSLGDTNGPCWDTPAIDELFSASFSGFGPASGLIFNRILQTNPVESGFFQAQEGIVAGSDTITTLELSTGRSMTNIVPLPRHIEARPGVLTLGIWIFTGAGHAAICAPPPCPPCVYFDGTIGAGCLFDPFYRLIPAPEFDIAPRPNARDLKPTRSTPNPTGVVGTWLALDGKYPSTDRGGYGDVPWSLNGEVWAHIKSTKLFPVLIAVAGEDGIINTVDDRVLFTGGGRDHRDGGEPSEPSAEIVLIPKSPP